MLQSLPRAPFTLWLTHYVGRSGFPEASRHLGKDEASVRRFCSDDRAAIELAIADDWFIAAGQPHMLAILYPQDVATQDRWCPTCEETVTVGDDERCPWCEHSHRRATSCRVSAKQDRRRSAEALRDAGLRHHEIAAQLGVTRSVVTRYLSEAAREQVVRRDHLLAGATANGFAGAEVGG